MKRLLLVYILLCCCVLSGCREDKTTVNLPVLPSLSPEEEQVVANCLIVQQAVEDFAQDAGRYPGDVTVDATPSGDTVTDLLPGGILLENPMTNVQTEPVNGPEAVNPGETSYRALYQGGSPVSYRITGFGEDSIIVTLAP